MKHTSKAKLAMLPVPTLKRRHLPGLLLLTMLYFKLNAAKAASSRMEHLTAQSTIADMIGHEAFKDFGVHLLPRHEDARRSLPLSSVSSLMPWHSHIRTDVVLDGLNRMIDDVHAGRQVFYSFYSDTRKKEQTGLFFFRGKPGAPFAVICPGGGFRYVGSLHEGFPPAQVISRAGLNAFVIEYRVGSQQTACEDLAAAIDFIFTHAKTLEVSTEGYSVWGGSAGARMAAVMGSFGPQAFGYMRPRPAAVITAYTGHTHFTADDPPTFAVVSNNDPIADADTMQWRIEAMKKAGIDARLMRFRHAGHGFGTGEGTDAENWMQSAVAFWLETINNKSKKE